MGGYLIHPIDLEVSLSMGDDGWQHDLRADDDDKTDTGTSANCWAGMKTFAHGGKRGREATSRLTTHHHQQTEKKKGKKKEKKVTIMGDPGIEPGFVRNMCSRLTTTNRPDH